MSLTAVLAEMNHLYARVGLAVVTKQGQRVVGRTVVDAHRLEIGERLGLQRVETAAQELRRIVDGNENGDFRHRA